MAARCYACVLPQNTKEKAVFLSEYCLDAPEGIRTPDLLVRSQTLYPTELLAHMKRREWDLNPRCSLTRILP